MTLPLLSPGDTRAAIDTGARLIDVRNAGEHARERIPGAANVPLECIADLPCDGQPVVFHCRSGQRTAGNVAQLAAAAGDVPAFILAGGIDAWRNAGHETIIDRSQPIDIMRQVQIVAGTLVVAGVLLGLLVSPGFFGLSAFVGSGLIFAGTTGWCGMANLLRIMPWNRAMTV